MSTQLAVIDALGESKHPKDDSITYTYGTAGFRTKGALLDSVVFRVGLLSALRSKFFGGKTIGVMVTASHNPEVDNGVKVIDPMGEMLALKWEGYATQLANVPGGGLAKALSSIIEAEGISMSVQANVVYGRDTRNTGPSLVKALEDGLHCMEAVGRDLGVVTTPMVHYVVCCINTNGAYGQPTEDGYFTKLSTAFKRLKKVQGTNDPLYLDCANGVGAMKVKDFTKYTGDAFPVVVVNDGQTGALNDQCGADFVKVAQAVPKGCNPQPGQRWASFDGDADRLVYFYVKDDGTFQLLDGDKIATLIGGYLGELVKELDIKVHLGVVQTAYANGSSTDYLVNTMNVPTACTPTGVKHIHHKAQEYDIGVYFEANGHGTVLFSEETQTRLKTMDRTILSASQSETLDKLLAMVDVINQTVGDALSDCLVVEAILSQKGWTLEDWNSCYADLPSRQLKVLVKDRTVITTTDAERVAVSPPGLQDAINVAVGMVPKGRSFVRPSGTEDIVRVYAEAETQQQADKLAYDVAKIVYDMAGGINGCPTNPNQ